MDQLNQQPMIPLSLKMDISAFPESDSAFILERLPSMNVRRKNHQLLYYQSVSYGFELLIVLGGNVADAPQPHQDPYSELDERPIEFLDLQCLSLGWILVDTSPDFFIINGDAENKFILSGDSILAFGRHFKHTTSAARLLSLNHLHSASAYSMDLSYLIQQYTQQLLHHEHETPVAANKEVHPSLSSRAQPLQANQLSHYSFATQPAKLLIDGQRLWKPVEINDIHDEDDDRFFFSALIPI